MFEAHFLYILLGMVYCLRHILDILAHGLMHIMVILITLFGGYSWRYWHEFYVIVSVLMMISGSNNNRLILLFVFNGGRKGHVK
jgi:hypothetical protein